MGRIALSLVGPIASPILSKLANTALSYFGGDITEEELQHLQNTVLPKIKAVLLVAEAKDVDALKPWLVTLKEAAYEAEDVLDMYEYQRLKAQVSSLPNYIKIIQKKARDVAAPLSHKTALKKSMEKLIKIAAGIDQFTPLIANFTGQAPVNQQQHAAASVSSPSSLVIGRDRERDSLVNMLISADNMPCTSSERRIPVLAIYGIGGAGKTTLAQSIYNDPKIVEHFDTRMWVHVSRKFDAHTVTVKIIESIKRGECPRVKNIDALQSILKDMLRSKRFLLVLDDVWLLEKELWDQMLIPLNEVGDMASRILITYRSEEVTSVLGVKLSFPLAELHEEDYWSIFKYYSFGDVKKVINDPELLDIARKIVKKLNKSPLAARMVGSSLRNKPTVEYWKQTLERGDMLKDTLGYLYWSFEHLPPYLQRCFALCSLYPKGYRFSNIENFVKLWIAQGFVEVPINNTITVENEAIWYFNELLSNSFFQKHIKDREEVYYVMHDLLHDLAEEVSKDYCFRIEDNRQRVPTNVMHLSVVCDTDISSHIPYIFKLVNLRTFIIVSTSDRYLSELHSNDILGFTTKVFIKFEKLRVLHLRYNGVLKLGKSVGRLKHLRSFQMGQVNKLPKSLGELYHLQFLVFWKLTIDKVYQNLNNLINLRYIRGNNEVITKIPLLGKLTYLQEIDRYEVSHRKNQFGIGQLKNLQQLRGSLPIYNLENVKDKAEASKASLNEKKHVDELVLHWKRSSERDGSMDEEVLQGLQPPTNLRALKLDGYNGVRLPKWTRNDGSLSDLYFIDLERLQYLEIVNCHNLLQVPSLPRMLRRLVIRGCANLSEVPLLPLGLEDLELEGWSGGVETMLSNMSLCNSENGSSIQGGVVLKSLGIERCYILGETELCLDKLTSLTHLTFTELPWLTSLLLGTSNLTALENVKIQSCENLKSIGNSLVSSLKSLSIINCPRLTVQQQQQQPDDPGVVIEFLLVAGCPELTSLWNLNCFTSLRDLSVMGCPKLTIKSGGDSLSPSSSSLRYVSIDDLSLLTDALTGRECCLNSLNQLLIRRSTQDKPFTAEQEELFQHLTSLEYLTFDSCEGLPSLPANLDKLSSLRDLDIGGCPKIESLPNLPASLEVVIIDDLSLLTAALPRRECLNSLSSLTIQKSTQPFTAEQEELFQYLTSLTSLTFNSCGGLPSLPANLEKLSSLRDLCLWDCPKIESLPNLPASLEQVDLGGCHPRLKRKYGNNKSFRGIQFTWWP